MTFYYNIFPYFSPYFTIEKGYYVAFYHSKISAKRAAPARAQESEPEAAAEAEPEAAAEARLTVFSAVFYD